jgi:hypothetical protein
MPLYSVLSSLSRKSASRLFLSVSATLGGVKHTQKGEQPINSVLAAALLIDYWVTVDEDHLHRMASKKIHRSER